MTQRRLRQAGAYAAYGALAIFFCAPLLTRPLALGILDWDVHLFYVGAVLKNLIEYGQLPFWNPWYCGGNVLWQNPQVALLSPVYPLALLLPLPLAMKLNIVVHYFLGFVGMHLLLTEVLELSFLPLVVFLASVFVLSGAVAMHIAVGHVNFLPAFYLPLMLYFFVRALKSGAIRDVVCAATFLALMIDNGGLHMVPLALVTVGAIGALTGVARRSVKPIVLCVMLGAMGFAYAAPKILPVALFVTGDRFLDARPPAAEANHMTGEMLLRAYLDPYQSRGMRFGWLEYGNYIGLPAALLIGASVLWILATREAPEAWLGRSLALTAVLLLALSAGEFGRFAPALLLHRVPFFSSFRLPSRYSIACVLVAVAAAAWAARTAAADVIAGPSTRRLATIFCALATIHLAAVNRGHFENVFQLAPLESTFRVMAHGTAPGHDTTVNPYGPNSPMLRTMMSGRSTFNCYEVMQLKRTAVAGRPLVYSDGDVRLFETVFAPNRVQFSVAAGQAPSRVFLNQNFANGWTSNAGPVSLDPAEGQLVATLAPGQTGRFWFEFTPAGFAPGMGLLALAIGASAIGWKRNVVL